MKKTLILLSFLCMTFAIFAEDNSGTSFNVSDETLVAMTSEPSFTMNPSILDTRDVSGLSHSQATLRSYSKEQKMALAGWILLPTGLAIAAIGIPILVEAIKMDNDSLYKSSLLGGAIADMFTRTMVGTLGSMFILVGGAATITGVVLLGVAYKRLDGHANLTHYDAMKPRRPLMTFNLQSSRDGLGFAIRF